MKKFLRVAFPLIGKKELISYFLLGLLSGVLNFLFINSVTRVVSYIGSGYYVSVSRELVIIFVCLILLFIWVKRSLSLLMMRVSQRISWSLRKQILALVLQSGYESFASRRHRIDAVIVNDVNTLTGASIGIIEFSISVIMVVSCFVYMATISLVLFGITLGVAMLGTGIYLLSNRRNMRSFEKTRALENQFQENFNAMMNGYKEIYIEPERGRIIFNKRIKNIANESYRTNLVASTLMLNNSMTGQVLFYLLISSVLLVFSVLLNIKPGDTISFAFTLTYLLGSLEAVTVMIPALMRAGVAAGNLSGLRQEMIDSGREQLTVNDNKQSRTDFREIEVRELSFTYQKGNTADSFVIGPVSGRFSAGEVVFIYGGNGSGKTTFIYTLLGLYYPQKGTIKVDGRVITKADYPWYRSLFAVVFSDYYLFEDIVSDQPVNKEEAAFYLGVFELEGKVTIEQNRFSTTNLSTGQRKRLALISAILENKKVLVLDEWAADQDPYFRSKFYTVIIPALKRKGMTIVAITHDDKYYNCADRLYKMEEGRLVEKDPAQNETALFAGNQTN